MTRHVPARIVAGTGRVNKGVRVVELLRSNDHVLISFVTSLLSDAGIKHSIADAHMSVIDGGIGALPNRVMVAEDQYDEARTLLADAEVSIEPR